MHIAKKIVGLIFSRMFITGLLLIIQAVWILLFLFRLTGNGTLISIVFTIVAALMALYVVWRDENPAYKMGWLILICLLPILGTTMYAFFGNKRPARHLKRKLEPIERLHCGDLIKYAATKGSSSTMKLDGRIRGTVEYLSNFGPYPIYKDTDVRYFSLGDYMYEELIKDLKSAKKFIFMEYFIWGKGYMLSTITDILIEKAKSGLDVRVIYDDVGSLGVIPANFKKRLERAGIKVLKFNPLRPFLSLIYNNRDHRKITVIDGNIGYTGGANIADEYINRIERFGHWKDSAIRLYGPAVFNLTVMFLNMWNGFKPTEASYDKFMPTEAEMGISGLVQPYGDTPLDKETTGENVYLDIINQAEDYVYIFTPYLIIDNEMQTALILAAKRGIDIRIVTPKIPDKKVVNHLTKSYYGPLIKAGIRIYEYTPGFIHSKSFVCDDKIAVVGTINMDYRSLFLHFECATLMIGCDAIKDIKMDCIDTFAKSDLIDISDIKLNFFSLLYTAVLRALSPLM